MTKHLIAAALCASLAVPSVLIAEEFASDEDQVSYGLGILIGEQLRRDFDSLNFDLLIEAIKAQHAGEETRITIQDASLAVQSHQTKQESERNAAVLQESQQYLQDNALRKDVMITESGLQYEVLEAGEGPKPAATDTVKVHYRGTLPDGTEFDSSYSRNAPAEFPLNRVIAGWTEGLQLMSPGAKFRFVIPANLGYGDRGSPPTIPGGATLIFEVELLEVTPAAG